MYREDVFVSINLGTGVWYKANSQNVTKPLT